MEKRFEIIVKDNLTKKQEIVDSISDRWIDFDGKQFEASLSDVMDRIKESIEDGTLFGV